MTDNNNSEFDKINDAEAEEETFESVSSEDVSEAAAEEGVKTIQTKKDFHSSFFEIIRTIFGAIVLAGLLNCFVFQIVSICQTSMYPTFNDGNRVFLCKCAYWFSEPESGDIVVFKTPARPDDLIKRVIGLPGDTIEISNGVLKRNGIALDEPYINGGSGNTKGSFYCVVPEGQYFCIGDNRNVSTDSRSPQIGCVPASDIKGKVLFCISPLSLIKNYNHSFADKD